MTTQRYWKIKYRLLGSAEAHVLYTINSLSGAKLAQENLLTEPNVTDAWIDEVDFQCRPLRRESNEQNPAMV